MHLHGLTHDQNANGMLSRHMVMDSYTNGIEYRNAVVGCSLCMRTVVVIVSKELAMELNTKSVNAPNVCWIMATCVECKL